MEILKGRGGGGSRLWNSEGMGGNAFWNFQRQGGVKTWKQSVVGYGYFLELPILTSCIIYYIKTVNQPWQLKQPHEAVLL